MAPHTRFPTAVALLLATACAAPAQSTDERQTRADALFARYTRRESPGLAVAVVRSGAVVFAKGYGLADVQHRTPMTTATVLDVGSVSKQFTGLAVAMLASDGKLSLDADIRSYLPEMSEALPRLSVRHLLHHTSGLRDFVGGLRLSGLPAGDTIGFDQMFRFATRQRTLNFLPGREYSYSNTNYSLLAHIVTRVSGQAFHTFVSEKLLRPLEMRQTGFPISAGALPEPAPSYVRNAAGKTERALNTLNVPGSSSLRTSVDDLARWVQNFADTRVGGRAAMELAWKPGALSSGEPIAYGFGVELQRYRGAATVEHSGGWAGYTSNIMHFPQHDCSIIVASNYGVINPIHAARALADIFLADVLGPADTTSVPIPVETHVAAEVIDRYQGVYRLGPAWYLRIGRDRNTLTARSGSEPLARAQARSDTAFWIPAYNAAVTFATDTATAKALVFRGTRAPRVDERGLTPPSALDEFADVYVSDELGTSYTVAVRGDRLELTNASGGPVALAHAWGDEFTGSEFPFTALVFERDPSGRVVAFSVYVNERNRNVRFSRRTN